MSTRKGALPPNYHCMPYFAKYAFIPFGLDKELGIPGYSLAPPSFQVYQREM